MNCECLWGNDSNYNDGNEEGSEEIGLLGCFFEFRIVEESVLVDLGIIILLRWMERFI